MTTYGVDSLSGLVFRIREFWRFAPLRLFPACAGGSGRDSRQSCWQDRLLESKALLAGHFGDYSLLFDIDTPVFFVFSDKAAEIVASSNEMDRPRNAGLRSVRIVLRCLGVFEEYLFA